jgi:catechol 2,3-dioxygenase-like lactoylglutathione lyase family enzyme
MTVKRMDNVGIVVEDIDAAIEFFTELGLELEGRAPIEGDWEDGATGLRDMFTVEDIDNTLARRGIKP